MINFHEKRLRKLKNEAKRGSSNPPLSAIFCAFLPSKSTKVNQSKQKIIVEWGCVKLSPSIPLSSKIGESKPPVHSGCTGGTLKEFHAMSNGKRLGPDSPRAASNAPDVTAPASGQNGDMSARGL
jgi:hypothetical protein